MRKTAPLLIVPECSAPGCHHAGDHYEMVKCRSCGDWYCAEHMAALEAERADGSLDARTAAVPTIKRVSLGPAGLAFNLGYCPACLDAASARLTADSAWLL